MPAEVKLSINGRALVVPAGTAVAAAMMLAAEACRQSVSGEPRFPCCGMGTCFECRAVVNGVPHQRTCQLLCQSGMQVETDG